MPNSSFTVTYSHCDVLFFFVFGCAHPCFSFILPCNARFIVHSSQFLFVSVSFSHFLYFYFRSAFCLLCVSCIQRLTVLWHTQYMRVFGLCKYVCATSEARFHCNPFFPRCCFFLCFFCSLLWSLGSFLFVVVIVIVVKLPVFVCLCKYMRKQKLVNIRIVESCEC